ncbi:hypothetical protein DXG03_000770 [Asterophora parasitica]|uniref:Chromo domain-containing protein n=1 Tax=Asterophora parasitica TaxID=117018 RepID=A0A9P7KFV1_9AGAR|nr:hypothetical protein DXG03_000770 [Asterophora parasitica]
MDSDEKEYEVETITQARVERGKRTKNLVWKYHVRWKGYGPSDDTWEPAESFADSEQIIERFWERSNVGDRDYRDFNLFKAGEEFLIVGPPRRKPKRKSLHSSSVSVPPPTPGPISTQAQQSASIAKEKRRRSPSIIEIQDSEGESPPRKRARESKRKSTRPALPTRTRRPLPARNVAAKTSTPPPQPTRSALKSARAPSVEDEVIPPSDDELDELSLNAPPPGKHVAGSQAVLHAFGTDDAAKTIQTPEIPPDVDMNQQSASPDPLFDDMKEQGLPFHRVKAANPKVKMVENPGIADFEGAIATKARLSRQNAEPSSSAAPTVGANRAKNASGFRPGPGRSSSGFVKKNTSSLLTFDKGRLKTVKGRYRKEPKERLKEPQPERYHDVESTAGSLWGTEEAPNDEIPGLSMSSGDEAPPTANELLRLAGADNNNDSDEALPDFEDDAPAANQSAPEPTSVSELTEPATELHPDQTRSSLQQSLALAKNKLFPSGATNAVINTLGAWKHSTIFGPLGLGSDSHNKSVPEPITSESSPPQSFFLNLDASVSIPIILSTRSPASTGSSSFDFIVANKGPPGKFYSEKAALAVLDTVRTCGPSAKILPDSSATPDNKGQFELFQSRLNVGELFLALMCPELLLAFCSSDSALLSQRLNISPTLLGHSGDVLVARVIIENHSAYADAVTDADAQRWQWSPTAST